MPSKEHSNSSPPDFKEKHFNECPIKNSKDYKELKGTQENIETQLYETETK